MEISLILSVVTILAGVLTVFAPCIFAFLPVILKGVDNGESIFKSLRVISGLAISVFIFSLLLKYSTVLINIPTSIWEMISGVILVIQGIFILNPDIWSRISISLKIENWGSGILQRVKGDSFLSDFLIGFALGPIFSSCSPTYAYIIGVMLPVSFGVGIYYLLLYILGFSSILLFISMFGNSVLKRFVNPKGLFKRFVGWVILIMGILIFFGIHKNIETFIITFLPFLNITLLDGDILRNVLGK